MILTWEKRYRRALRRRISKIPAIYNPIRRLRSPETAVTAKTELLIEGFPRSGNTWTEALIRACSKRDIRLSHHSHSAAQVKFAVSRGIPTLLLFREPDHAVLSYLTLTENRVGIREALLDYISFYEEVLNLPEQDLLFVSFDDVTSRPVEIVKTLSSRFAMALDAGIMASETGRDEIFRLMDAKAVKLRGLGATSSCRPIDRSRLENHHRLLAEKALQSQHVQTERLKCQELFEIMCQRSTANA